MADLQMGRVERVSIDRVIPYWRNPRRVTAEAVEGLVRSITEYGYQQPIVVDAEMVIIVGHTRYSAMRKLDVTEVDVLIADYLSDRQVKQLRVVDNRAAEYSSWDLDKLIEELEDSSSPMMMSLFPEIIDADNLDSYDKGKDTRDFKEEWDEVDSTVEFVCPSCFAGFEAEVTREDIIAGRIEITEFEDDDETQTEETP